MLSPVPPTSIPDEAKQRLKLLFIAKHALGDGTPHPEDGTHAVYHFEIRTILEDLGLNIELADNYRSLFAPTDVDFVFPLLNRGGFLNSEMLLPLLCNRLGLPYLGASPILRGVSDDKHFTKLAARAAGLDTLDWAVFRRGVPIDTALLPVADRLVIKPNASSASWGVGDAHDAASAVEAIARLHEEGHDAIVEPFLDGHDIEVSVITVGGQPLILPIQMNVQADPAELRTYAEKRDLASSGQRYRMERFDDPAWTREIVAMTQRLLPTFTPFDYGRWEFRLDAKGERLVFLEVNLNCNLWSRKTISKAAVAYGWTQPQLIETIVAESMLRQGLFAR